jgi:hypothetical protein
MQLANIKKELGVATCALLQVPAAAVHASDSDWDIDTAVLFYSESDNGVSAFEPAIYAGKDLGDGERIDLRLVVDVLTGATPNGAHPSSVAQTFTTPSGGSSYTTQPGETPRDDSFKDTRVAAGVDWTLPFNRLQRIKLGLNGSTEYDYQSLGVSATYLQDFNNRNTTFSAGLAFNNDTISPVGGVPIALSPMRQPGQTNRVGGDDTKTVTDFILGITQVISRKTLVQLNYSLGMSDGYLTDPYKIVTVVDPVTGEPTTSGLSNVNADALPYVYEKRPDSRQINSLYFKTVHHLTRDVINFSYRYFWDDWGINSNTFDLKYRYEIGRGYLQPQLRYYLQDAADFYRHNLVQGTDVDASGTVLLDTVSSDYRLAKMTTTTLSLKYGHAVGDNSEWSIRAGLMNQSVDDGDVLAGTETPDTDAIIVNAGYSFFW